MDTTRLAAHAAPFLLDLSLRSTAFLAVAGLLCLGLRRASAATRHLLWTVTLLGLLCLPVLSAWLPPLAAPILPPTGWWEAGGEAPAASFATASLSRLRDAAPAPFGSSSDPDADGNGARASLQDQSAPLLSPSWSVPQTPAAGTGAEASVCLAWLIGVGIALLRTGIGLLGAVRLVRRARPIAAVPILQATEDARRRLGLRAFLVLREGHPAAPVAVPMTFGGRRPVILLPQEAGEWPAERLRAVMMHEMAHIGRGDWVTKMLAQIVFALYWFHPLVWLAVRRLRTEAEVACDDLVLTHGVAAPDYAEHLLDVVRGLAGRRATAAVVTMAHRREVKTRLQTILAERRNRSGVTGRALTLAASAALSLAVPLAAVHPVAAVADTASHVGGKTRWLWTQIAQAQHALNQAQTSLKNSPMASSFPTFCLEPVPNGHLDARSIALLQKVQAATRAAHSLEANLTYTVRYPGEAAKGFAGQMPVKLMKPNYAAISLAESKWSPLANLTPDNRPTTTRRAPDGSDLRVWDSIVVQAFFDSSKAVKSWIYVGNLGELTYAGTETVAGTQYQVLKHLMMGTLRGKPCPFMQRLYIGPDYLIHRYRLDFKYNGRPGVQIADLHNIRLNIPLPSSDFPSDAPPAAPPAGETTGGRASREVVPEPAH